MSRIPTPKNIEAAPEASQSLLKNVEKSLGIVPNLFRLVANSPATLQGYLGLNGALAGGALDPATRERIALAVAEINGCDYCLAAHTYLGLNVAKLTGTEIDTNRRGYSTYAKADAALRFAVELVQKRGAINARAVDQIRNAGYSDAEILEVIGHVALNTFTNYVNEALGTEVDFPEVKALEVA